MKSERQPSRKDHLPYEARHIDDVEWETIRWPGETGKMLFHPTPERPTMRETFDAWLAADGACTVDYTADAPAVRVRPMLLYAAGLFAGVAVSVLASGS